MYMLLSLWMEKLISGRQEMCELFVYMRWKLCAMLNFCVTCAGVSWPHRVLRLALLPPARNSWKQLAVASSDLYDLYDLDADVSMAWMCIRVMVISYLIIHSISVAHHLRAAAFALLLGAGAVRLLKLDPFFCRVACWICSGEKETRGAAAIDWSAAKCRR